MTSKGLDYETEVEGIRILPGQWRPHYPFEQIIWISPPWPSQDYIWLDFPEAIFADSGLHYLSHVNPAVPALFHDLPKVPWKTGNDGLSFERVLPNAVKFGRHSAKRQRLVNFAHALYRKRKRASSDEYTTSNLCLPERDQGILRLYSDK